MKIHTLRHSLVFTSLFNAALLFVSLGIPSEAFAQDAQEEKFLRARLLQNGEPIPPDTYDRAMEQWRRLPKTKPATPGAIFPASAGSGVNGTVWKPIGPSPLKLDDGFVNGRVHAIAVNPN